MQHIKHLPDKHLQVSHQTSETDPGTVAHLYLLPYSLPLPFLESVPSSKCFVLLIGFIRLALHLLHSNLRTIFFVVLAFLWKTGFVCPPKPACFLSYRRFPWAVKDALPVLYCETLCGVCLLHFLQKVLR